MNDTNGQWLPVQFSEVRIEELVFCLREWQSRRDETIQCIVNRIGSSISAAQAEGAKSVAVTWENKLDWHENPDGLIGKVRLVHQR